MARGRISPIPRDLISESETHLVTCQSYTGILTFRIRHRVLVKKKHGGVPYQYYPGTLTSDLMPEDVGALKAF